VAELIYLAARGADQIPQDLAMIAWLLAHENIGLRDGSSVLVKWPRLGFGYRLWTEIGGLGEPSGFC
jgi:hypothetical protein